MRRGTLLLLVGIGAPTALLAIGWLLASQREAEGRQREALALLSRHAEIVRGVVDASLDEMRVRENARPFDAYNYVYNPPGIVSVGDALALSPLAREPEDARIIGYFQIDPGGAVRTPYERDASQRKSPRALDVVARVEGPAFGELRQQALHAPRGDDGERVASIQAYNTLQNEVYEELQQANSDLVRRVELAFEDKKVPVTQRNGVPWSSGSRPFNNKKHPPQQAAVKPKQQAAATPDDAPVVDYTPFVFDSFGDDLVLYRLVSSAGSKSVQGVLLDKGTIFDRWLPAVVERHSAATRPKVLRSAAPGTCALRTEASDVLEGVDLCFPPEALAQVKGIPATELGLLFTLVSVVALAAVVTDRAARRADELARQRGSFISAVSHELRTPLTTLRMHAEMLRDGLIASDDKKRKFHDDMVQESVRLSHLVENVLEATRLEEGRRPLRAHLGDLGGAVRAVCATQSGFVQPKGFTIEVQADEIECRFDRQAVEQIVVNLIDNAVKYASDGDRVVRVEVAREGGDAVLRVLDRGPGIPPDHLERVFLRFHRVERPGLDHVVGTGLGLSLVRELALAHGGSATARAREGGGCCVEVRLPTQQAQA